MPPGQLQKNKQQQKNVLTPQKLELLQENRKLLSHIFNMGNLNGKDNLHSVMLRMRRAMIEKKIDVSKISKKIKGKIVSQLLRYESHTSLHEAFLRWKVRADPEIVKKAVDQILLNSRLNEFNAFHKLKNLLGQKDLQKKMNAKKRKNMCLMNLALFLQKKEFQLKTAAVAALKPKNQDSDKMLGLLLWSISSKHRERYLREKFNWWRLYSKVKSDKLQKQLKALERLGDEYNMRNDRLDRQRLKEAFEKWRGDLMNFRLKKKFFSVLLKTTFGRLQRCYTRWVDLPDKRENDMKKQGMLLITKLTNKADQNKRLVWNSFKAIDDDAKNKKTKVIRELIEVTFNQSYTAFYKWANYNTYAKLTETNLRKIKALQASANVTQQLVKFETFKLFGLSKKAEICSFLNKLILKIQQRQKIDALRQIENVSMQKKMQEKLDNVNKQEIISRLGDTANKTEKGLLRQVLRKFALLREQQEIKNKYFVRIISTTSGMAMDAFRRWKQLPDPAEQQMLQNVSKFQLRLQFLFKQRVKQSFDPLKEVYYQGIQSKRLCIKQMLVKQLSAPQRFLRQWQSMNKIYKSVIACQKTNNFFDSLQDVLKNNIKAFLSTRKDAEIKEKCLIKLMSSFTNNLMIAFLKWKNYNKQQKISENLGDEKKKFMLLNLERFIKNDNLNRLRRILRLFYNEQQVNQLIKKIQLRVLQTQIGQVELSFQKWKSLPGDDALKNQAKVSKFAISLGKISYRFVKLNSWDQLENNLLDGQAKKKFCINKIIAITQSDLKKAFLLWHRKAWEMKMFDKFSQLNVTLNDQIVKQKLIGWINAGSKVKFFALTEVLRRFNQNAIEHNLKRKAMAIINRNTISQVWLSFNRWKQLPEDNNNDLKVQATKFEESLSKFAFHILKKHTWNPLQEVYDDGLAIKKRSVLLMIKTQESEQQRTLDQWNKNVSLIREVERCKVVISLFGLLGLHIKNNIAPLKPDEESQKKEKALLRLIGNFDSNLRYFFMKWYNDGKLEKLQGAMTDEKKKLLLEAINNFSKNNDFARLRAILAKFRRNSSITAVQDRFFAKLFATQFGGAIKAFQKWKNLPEPVNTEQLKNARKFERTLDILFHSHLKVSFDPLKEDYMDALNIKRMCLRKLFEKSMSAHKRLFLLWAQQNRQAKQIEVCRLTTALFVGLAQIVTANVQPIMQNPREAQAKEKALHLIFQGQTENLLRAFFKWRNWSQQDRMNDNLVNQLQSEQRKELVDRLQGFCHGNKLNLYRLILAKFSLAHKKEKLILQINARILRTQIGAVWDTFNKWKNLPEANADELIKASKFETQLNKFTLHIWRKRTWNPLQEVYDDAQALKKRAIILMIKTQESEQQRALDQWNKNVGLMKEVERCKCVIGLFGFIGVHIKNNIAPLKPDEESQKKEKALLRLIGNFDSNLRYFFMKWYNDGKLEKLQGAMTDEKKKLLLEAINNFSKNNDFARLRAILAKFRRNSSITAVQDRFFAKLFATQFGGAIKAFQKWKNLPEPVNTEQLKNARKFERTLDILFHSHLKVSFDPLKEDYMDALNIKRMCLRKLFEKSMSAHKRLFLLWAQQNRQAKQIEVCRLTTALFVGLAQIVTANVQPIMQNPREAQAKEKALHLIFQGQTENLLRAFFKWRNWSQQDRMNDNLVNQLQSEQRKELVDRLQGFCHGNKLNLYRLILAKFSLAHKKEKLILQINARILRTQIGAVWDTFNKWKNLPEANADELIKASKFETQLNKFTLHIWRKRTWNPLQEVYDDAQALKKRAIILMIKTQESEQQRALDQWNKNVGLMKEVERCKCVIGLFGFIGVHIKNNIAPLKPDEESQKKEKALLRLIGNFDSNLRYFFMKWYNDGKLEKLQGAMTDEKKKLLLEAINNFSKNNDFARLRAILAKFRRNSSITAVQDRFFAKLFATQFGGAIKAFQKWKNLPEPVNTEQLKNARKFERTLDILFHSHLKVSFDPLKEDYMDALNIKRMCLRKLFEKSMSAHKRLFLLWAQQNRQAKQIEVCRLTTALFVGLAQIVTANVQPIMQNPREAQAKEKALHLIFQGQTENLLRAFFKWRNWSQQDRMNDNLVNQLQSEQRKELVDRLQGFCHGNKLNLYRLILAKFSLAHKKEKLILQINARILRTQIGAVWDTFNKWKNLPEANADELIKASKFETQLNKFTLHIWRKRTWNPLQEVYDDAQALKKRAIILMIKTQESEQQRALDQWNKNVGLMKEVERCKCVIGLFGFIGVHIKNNIAPLKPDEESQKKEKALLRLIGNFDSNLRYFFMKWYNDGKLEKLQGAMTDEKKKLLLEAINNFSKNNDFARLRAILAKFRRNSSITAVQDRFFAKLFATQFGGAIKAFQKWKNLPEPVNTEQLKNARKFERTLDILFHSHLKVSFDPLKEDYMDALNIKRMCLRKLFEKSMSAHKRLFLLWAQQNRQAKQIEVCRLTTALFVGLAQIVTANVQPIMQNPREAQAKEKALHLIFQGQAENLSRAFFLWRNRAQQERMNQNFEDALTIEKKKQLTEQLVQFENGNKFALYRQILAKFSLAHKKEKLILQINARILRTQIGAVWDTFNKWKNLPEANADELIKASKFETQLNKFTLHIWRKRTWNPLQEVYDDAQALKKRAIILMIKTQESEQQRALDQWNKNVGLMKEVERCKCVIGLFGFIGVHIKNNIAPLKPDEESQKKEKALLRLIGNFDSNLRYFFMKWYNDGKLEKLQGAMTDEKKKLLLEAINNFSKNNDFARLRAILAKFRRNSSITAVQDRFFAKLFATQFGGAIKAFQKWKNLPEPVNTEQLKNARKFERTLDILFHSHLKVSFDPLKEDYMDALNIKRMCLRKLFEKSMSAHKRLFLLWAQQNRQAKQIEVCRLTTALFVGLAQIVTANVQPIMQNPREAQAKEKALHLIFQGQAENLSRAFFLWRNRAQQERMNQNFEDALTIEKKKQLTEQLVQFENGNKFALYRQILAKFSLAHKKEKLILQINARILRTQIGAVWDTFNKWKNLPEANADELIKASKFETQLNKFTLHIWRKRTWNPLQEVYDDAQALKKRAIILMIKTQESEQQRALDQWNKNVGLMKEVERCKCVIGLFGFIGVHIKNNIAPLKPDEESQKKEKALLRLIGNFDSNLRYFFMKWYNDGKLEKLQGAMTDEKKKLLLEAINNFSKNNDFARLRAILAKFRRNSSITAVQDRFFAKLFATQFGGAIKAFQKWKNLPEPVNNEQMKNARKFERTLDLLFRGRVKASFEPLKDVYQEGNSKKLYCLRKLMTLAMGQNKRLFLYWRDINRLHKSIETCKYTTNLFQTLAFTLAGHVQTIFKPNKQQESVLAKMLQNYNNTLRWAFVHWNNQAKQAKIQTQLDDEKKKLLLFALHRNLRTNDQGKLRDILRKFSKERQKQALIKKIQIQLLHTFVGQIEVSFSKWKALPDTKELDQMKANIFEKSLNRFKIHMMRKSTYNQLYNIYLDGQAKQKYSINKMLYNCMSAQKKAFLKWYKVVEFSKAAEAFDISDKKKLAIQLFYQHKMNQLNVAFVEWKRLSSHLTNKQETAQEREVRLKREAILLFQNFAQIRLRIYFQRWNIRAVKKNMISVFNAIQKLLLFNMKQDRELIKEALDIWRGPKLQNQWFQRVAEMIAKNTRITPQIAFWRMRDNATTQKAVSLNTLQIVKCKKLINNLLKAYDRVRQRAFTNIEHFGRGITDASSFQPSHSSFLQQTPVRDSQAKSQMESIILKNSQQVALSTLQRVFRRHLKFRFTELVLIASQCQKLGEQMLKSSIQPTQYKFIHKKMATEKLIGVIERNLQLKELVFLNSIANQSDPDLLKRMNELIEENSRLRDQATNDETINSKDQQISEQQRLIQDLNTRLDRMRGQRMIKSLEEYQDHLVEDGFFAIEEYKKE
ncbi:unnamed protein product [Paramecium octaurelia]|uniref:Uncharacterized protein n=1 Tax=Paramecium octaurelia TaxID=43137 RepID=A0A8S1YAL0_PAROT|nr:unnamed protein product [Paramecium octaurelia]